MLDKKMLELIEKAKIGDKDAFLRLCEKKGRDILYISIHLMGNLQDGEDAAQEILLYVYNHIGELKEPKAFQVWIFRITRSICMDMKRKMSKKRTGDKGK